MTDDPRNPDKDGDTAAETISPSQAESTGAVTGEPTDDDPAGSSAENAQAVTESAPGDEQAPAQIYIPDVLPVLRTGASVLYPAIVVPLVTSEEPDVRAIDDAVTNTARIIAVVALKHGQSGAYDGDLQPVGTAAQIIRMAKTPNGTLQALIQGVRRVRIVGIEQDEPWIRARVESIEEVAEPSTELEALTRNAAGLFQNIVTLSEVIPGELAAAVSQINQPGNLADFIAANANLKPEDRQAVLEAANVTDRLRVLGAALAAELAVLEVSSQIRTQVRGDLDKRQREFILRDTDARDPERAWRRRSTRDRRAAPQDRRSAPARRGAEAGGSRVGAAGADDAGGGRIPGCPHLPRMARRSSMG